VVVLLQLLIHHLDSEVHQLPMGIQAVRHGIIQMAERKKKRVNREQHLIETFPLEDRTTYIQSLDKHLLCEYSGLPSLESYRNDICPKCSNLLGEDEYGWYPDEGI
jgi:hypothetical protein